MRPTGLQALSEKLLPMKITDCLVEYSIFIDVVSINRSLLVDPGLKQSESFGQKPRVQSRKVSFAVNGVQRVTDFLERGRFKICIPLLYENKCGDAASCGNSLD